MWGAVCGSVEEISHGWYVTETGAYVSLLTRTLFLWDSRFAAAQICPHLRVVHHVNWGNRHRRVPPELTKDDQCVPAETASAKDPIKVTFRVSGGPLSLH